MTLKTEIFADLPDLSSMELELKVVLQPLVKRISI